MTEHRGGVVVGVLGQWASGKSTAAKTLIRYLGGESEVTFLTDFVTFAHQAVDHLLSLEEEQIESSIEAEGVRRLKGELATVWLDPMEELESIDLNSVTFRVNDDVLPAWLNGARVELGHQVCEECSQGRPVVVEAGFGGNPADHTIADLFVAFEEAGVAPGQVKWIIVEAGYDTRAQRNAAREIGPPVDVFAQYAADGGDLDPDQQARLEERGEMFKRVSNNHDDVERFRADIVSAFQELFG